MVEHSNKFIGYLAPGERAVVKVACTAGNLSALTIIKEERIATLEKRVAELEKFIKTHLHSQSGQTY